MLQVGATELGAVAGRAVEVRLLEIAPSRSAFAKVESLRSTPRKSTPRATAPSNKVLMKAAPESLTLVRSIFGKYALKTRAPRRSAPSSFTRAIVALERSTPAKD